MKYDSSLRAIPPHRSNLLSTPAQRLAMLQAAIEGQPGFKIDKRELEQEGKSYTVHTLRSLREEIGAAAALLAHRHGCLSWFP